MGSAGLDVKRLSSLLQRIKVDCSIVEGDELFDHCVLRLSSIKCPGQIAFIEYINQGDEPRLIGIKIEPRKSEELGQSFQISEEWIKLRGKRSDDTEKIITLIEQTFLRQ
ncbi:MAG: hypothetical protein H0V88_11900 [Pyrinomonadaceae bacterium]|nr:hypothetical protein [Pyrinomonadaceae bacterium]